MIDKTFELPKYFRGIGKSFVIKNILDSFDKGEMKIGDTIPLMSAEGIILNDDVTKCPEPTYDTVIISQELIDNLRRKLSHYYFGVKFPGYFQNPRFVETESGVFTMEIDDTCLTYDEANKFHTNGLRSHLAELSKQVLRNMTNSKIKEKWKSKQWI